MGAVLQEGRPFALVTISRAEGGPRRPGAQMVVTEGDWWGFVSGGCVEADVALQARAALADGEPRQLVYGRGSPWLDTPLPCGGRLELLVEPIDPGDPAIETLVAAYLQRQVVRYQTDGHLRQCGPATQARAGAWLVDHVFTPPQRLIVFGSDPIALGIAALGASIGWASVIIRAGGPAEPPGLGITCRSDAPDLALLNLAPDAQTAIAVATHDLHYDESAILAALGSDAGYIGVLGARSRIPERVERLKRAGVTEGQIARLHMPIGLALGAAAPWEIAVSVIAQIMAERQSSAPPQ